MVTLNPNTLAEEGKRQTGEFTTSRSNDLLKTFSGTMEMVGLAISDPKQMLEILREMGKEEKPLTPRELIDKYKFKKGEKPLAETEHHAGKIPEVYGRLSDFLSVFPQKDRSSALKPVEALSKGLIDWIKRTQLFENRWKSTVRYFWQNEVGRPIYNPNAEIGLQYVQETGDRDLGNEHGCYGQEGRIEPADVFMGTAKLIQEELRMLVVRRKREYLRNLTTDPDAPQQFCPIPEAQTYYVTFRKGRLLDEKTGEVEHLYKKVAIRRDLIHDDTQEKLNELYHSIRTQLLSTEKWHKDGEAEISLAEEAYVENFTVQGARDFRVLANRPDTSDMVVLFSHADDVNVQFCQRDRRNFTHGNKTPIVVALGIKDNAITKFFAKVNHPGGDGARVQQELAAIWDKVSGTPSFLGEKLTHPAHLLARLRGALNKPSASYGKWVQQEQIFSEGITKLNVEQKKELTEIADEYEKEPQRFVFEISDAAIDKLNFANAHNPAYSLQNLCQLAAMSALGVERSHYIESTGEGLAPAIFLGRQEVWEKCNRGEPLNAEDMLYIEAAATIGRFDRNAIKNKEGTVPVTVGSVGDMREAMRVTSPFLNPGRASLVTGLPMMGSHLTNPIRDNVKVPGKMRFTGFSTALTTNFIGHVVGFIDMNRNNIAVTLRTRANFPGDTSRFEQKFNIAFQAILEGAYRQAKMAKFAKDVKTKGKEELDNKPLTTRLLEKRLENLP